MLDPNDKNRLYWLSGSTCTGKTTISSLIGEKLNWNVFHCDEYERAQGERADPDKHPTWHHYSRITGDELWFLERDEHVRVQEQAANEQLELIVEDLIKFLKEDGRPLLYDGYVSPEQLDGLIPSKRHAYYMVAEEEFQRRNYAERQWTKNVLAKTSDPEQAWDNWMYRDVTRARLLRQDIEKHGYAWHMVDGSISIEETVDKVIAHFTGV